METETKKSPDGKKKGGGGGGSQGPAKCALKFLTPEALAGAIVGREGSKIAAMREQFSAGVQLSDWRDTYPGTDCRMLTIQCGTEDGLLDLAKHILGIQSELIKPEELKKNKNSTAAAGSLGKDGDLKVYMLVPRAAGGGIIGKGGAVIKQLRESSGAKKVMLGDAASKDPTSDQKITVVGPMESIEVVLKEVNKQVQALKGEAWFPSWVAAGPSAASSGGESWGGTYADAGGWSSWDDWSGGWGNDSGIDTLVQVARETPPMVLEDSRGFAMNCTVPKKLVGGLIGRRGANIQGVKERTSTDISIREIPDDPEHNTLNIVGPLPNACAAYMLMMKLYLDAEDE